MTFLHLALGTLFSAFTGIYIGTDLAGWLAVGMAVLSLSQGSFLGAYTPNTLTVKFDKSRLQWIFTLRDPTHFTNFMYSWNEDVNFTSYTLIKRYENGKGQTKESGAAPFNRTILLHQNYTGNPKISAIELTLTLDPNDTSNRSKFKNAAKLGNFLLSGGGSLLKKSEDAVDWFKNSPAL